MLDKIKTLKEILKPDAIKLDIPVDDYIETYTEDERFELFTKHFNQKNSSPFYMWSHISNLSCLIKTKEMVNFISEKFNVTVSEDLYSKWLKEYVQNWIKGKEFIDSNYRNAEIGRPIVINVPGIDMEGVPEKRREREEEEWYQKRIERSRNTQDVIKYFIEVLGINLKSSKYTVVIIDGIEELKKYKDIIKNEFGLNVWLEDYMVTKNKNHIARGYTSKMFASGDYDLQQAKQMDDNMFKYGVHWPSTGWRYAMNGKYRKIVSNRSRSSIVPGHGDINFNANIMCEIDRVHFGWCLDSLESDIKFLKSNIEKIQEACQFIDEIRFSENTKHEEIKRKTEDLYGSTKAAKLNTRQAKYEMSILWYEHAVELLKHPKREEMSKIINDSFFDKRWCFLDIFTPKNKVKPYYYRTKSQELHLLKLKDNLELIK